MKNQNLKKIRKAERKVKDLAEKTIANLQERRPNPNIERSPKDVTIQVRKRNIENQNLLINHQINEKQQPANAPKKVLPEKKRRFWSQILHQRGMFFFNSYLHYICTCMKSRGF